MSRGKGIIVGQVCPRIRLCPTCGRMRVHHPAGLYACPVPAEVTRALRRFRAAHGTRWKAKLLGVWQAACAAVPEPDRGPLQQARNLIGPANLYKIDLGPEGV